MREVEARSRLPAGIAPVARTRDSGIPAGGGSLAVPMDELPDTEDGEVPLVPLRLARPWQRADDRCQRCGAGPGSRLLVVRLESAGFRARRTLCDYCASVLFEAFIEADEDFVDATEEPLAVVR
jgi:hypothetical protein